MVVESDKGKFLRTVLRSDVYDRLTAFAQNFSSGLDKWDYGVAIQILLDFYDNNSNISQVNGKLDYLLSNLVKQEEEVQEEPKKETGIEMLGGEILK